MTETDAPDQASEYDGPIPPTYAQVRYATRDTPGVIWYDPRDHRESIQLDHSETADELPVGQRRLGGAAITPYRPAEFGTPAQQYRTQLVSQEGDTHGSRSFARTQVHDSLAAAQAHLSKHVPGYDDAPRRDAVRHRTGFRRHHLRQRGGGPAMNNGGPNGYDPFAFVPERISSITAGGLTWLDEQLHEENQARLRALPIERQANLLATLLGTGAIGVRPDAVQDLLDAGTIRASEDNSDRQEADR